MGTVLLGSHVIKTVGKGIVPLDLYNQQTCYLITFTSLLGASLWVTIATYKKLPVSTSHSIVGAVAGAGLAMNTVVKWEKMLQIVICWIFTPVGAGILAFLIYPVIKKVFSIKIAQKYEEMLVVIFIYLTSIYLAFSWGANDVANATGVLISVGTFNFQQAAVIGGLAIVFGITTWGYKVIETVGFQITNLTPLMTISAEIASALNVHLYTLAGIPVSTSHSIVGAIWGVGLAHGIKNLNLKLVRDIVTTWALTPVAAGLISFLILKLILFLRVLRAY